MAKSLAICANPIIPNRTTEIWKEQLNFAGSPCDDNAWDFAGKIDISKDHSTCAPKPLYARVDDEMLENRKAEFANVLNLKEHLR